MGLADTYELLHSCPALFAVTEIAFAHCLPDEIGHGCLFPASTSVERSPQLVVEIQLRAPHDVYCTSFFGQASDTSIPALTMLCRLVGTYCVLKAENDTLQESRR